MVSVSMIVEGGSLSTDTFEQAVSNNAALRQAMHRIFSEALGRNDISVSIDLAGGNRSATKKFIDSQEVRFLYTDLDRTKDKRDEWFTYMERNNPQKPLVVPEDKRPYVFFMIQEMEAWMLKQPHAIDRWAEEKHLTRKKENESVCNHPKLNVDDVEGISKPSKALADIIKQVYESGELRRNGKPKKAEYGKLKDSPSILNKINVKLLFANDSELQSFCKKVEETYPRE